MKLLKLACFVLVWHVVSTAAPIAQSPVTITLVRWPFT